MTAVKDVTGTAFIVAEFRADGNSEDEPLYRDEIVKLFLDADTKKAADSFSSDFPAIKRLVQIRTCYFDDRLDEQIRRGVRQIVILGAGFDTRPIRKQTSSVTYFEVDDPSTLDLKQVRLAANDIPVGSKYVHGNYVSDNLIAMLESRGFDCSLPAHFIWEGNTMYLTEDSVRGIMTDIAWHVEQFTLAFDYFAPEVIAKTTGDHGITGIVERFAAIGAPWIFGIGDLPKVARQAGMSVVENRTTADLYRAYRPNGFFDSPLYGYYSLCTLEPAQ
jgi:methyltransferase (TIGR00027 family)